MSDSQENEKYNKNSDLKIFDNFVAACHLLCVGGGQQSLARQETKPTLGVARRARSARRAAILGRRFSGTRVWHYSNY